MNSCDECREALSLSELRKHFVADIGARIVGVTPSSHSRAEEAAAELARKLG